MLRVSRLLRSQESTPTDAQRLLRQAMPGAVLCHRNWTELGGVFVFQLYILLPYECGTDLIWNVCATIFCRWDFPPKFTVYLNFQPGRKGIFKADGEFTVDRIFFWTHGFVMDIFWLVRFFVCWWYLLEVGELLIAEIMHRLRSINP